MMLARNPYSPTRAALDSEGLREPGEVIEIASRRRLLANFLIDLVAYVFLSMLIGIVNAALFLSFRVDLVGLVGPFFSLAVLFMYYFLGEVFLGKTLGKFVTRTRVIAESGARAVTADICPNCLPLRTA
jgi:uncharacterized RDD family membrane protein YckC